MTNPASLSGAMFAIIFCVGSLLALGVLALIKRPGSPAQPVMRFAPLDGLRGFAALAVFFHHAAAWQTLSIDGRWDFGSKLAWVVGPTAVSLFFMVTAFLFVDKVVFAPRPPDWLRLYVSRVTRMMPLFLFVFAMVLVVVAAKTSSLNEPPAELLLNILCWLPLTLFGTPDINGLNQSWLTVAGATWTLPYECLFYLALPAIALVCGRRSLGMTATLIASVAFVAVLMTLIVPSSYDWKWIAQRLLAFPAGALAALLVQSPAWRQWASGRLATIVAVLAGLVSLYVSSHYSYTVGVFLQAIFFAVVAGGNSIGGLLTSNSARHLGEISYSVYLLHGLLLYVVVGELIGAERIAHWPMLVYWGVVLALVPVLLTVCLATYRYIEYPGIASASGFTAQIRSLVRRGAPEKV